MKSRRRIAAGLLLVLAAGACGEGEALFPAPSPDGGTAAPTSSPAAVPTTGPSPASTAPIAPTSTAAEQTTAAATTTTTEAEATTTTTTEPPPPPTIDEVVQATVADLEAFWTARLPDTYGIDYDPIDDLIPYFPSTGDVPRCGPETLPADLAADNAFYCQPDDYVAWDAEGLLPDLYTEFGDFAISLVLAHEWGHAAQARARVTGPTILTELQADCFAGTWTGDVAAGGRTLRLGEGDLEEAMAGYLLFRDPVGTRPGDPGAHGSAFDRVNAFQDGFFNGIGTCVDYEQGDFEVIDIPLTVQDLESGGDLPYDDVEPSLTGSLETYWELTYPDLFGSAWEPVSDFGAYFPSSGTLPACGSREPDPEEYRDNAFYCPEDDFVAWDGESLFPDLYQSIGDFALGMVLGHEWGTAVQARAGRGTEGIRAELQADCFTGAWSAVMVPFDNPTGIVLSAGDLDEAIAGFLAFAEGSTGVASSGTAFERFDAFKNGFFNGAAACLEE